VPSGVGRWIRLLARSCLGAWGKGKIEGADSPKKVAIDSNVFNRAPVYTLTSGSANGGHDEIEKGDLRKMEKSRGLVWCERGTEGERSATALRRGFS